MRASWACRLRAHVSQWVANLLSIGKLVVGNSATTRSRSPEDASAGHLASGSPDGGTISAASASGLTRQRRSSWWADGLGNHC
jgi:hypothetical protein